MLTDEARARALARYQAAPQPPVTDERVARIAALFARLRLRIAHDRARDHACQIPELNNRLPASNAPPNPGVSAGGNSLVSGTEVSERELGGADRV